MPTSDKHSDFRSWLVSISPTAPTQYGLPYTIIRPFNCVGTGEQRALGGREFKWQR